MIHDLIQLCENITRDVLEGGRILSSCGFGGGEVLNVPSGAARNS